MIENDIEQLAIATLQTLGYAYQYGPDLAADGPTPQRRGLDDVLLLPQLQAQGHSVLEKISIRARFGRAAN